MLVFGSGDRAKVRTMLLGSVGSRSPIPLTTRGHSEQRPPDADPGCWTSSNMNPRTHLLRMNRAIPRFRRRISGTDWRRAAVGKQTPASVEVGRLRWHAHRDGYRSDARALTLRLGLVDPCRHSGGSAVWRGCPWVRLESFISASSRCRRPFTSCSRASLSRSRHTE